MSNEPQSAATGEPGTMTEPSEPLADAEQPRIESAPAVMPPSTEEDGEEVRTEKPEPAKAFGSLTASEAASLRWERQRQREASEAAQAVHERQGEAIVVRTTVQTGEIIGKLAGLAKGGNTQAARELREWLDRSDIERDTDLTTLDRRVVQEMKARLLAEIQADEAGTSTIEPSDEVAPEPEGEATPATGGTPVDADA